MLRSTFPPRPLRRTANKPDPPVWLVCNIKINVSAEYTQGAAEDLLNQKLSLSSHIHRSRWWCWHCLPDFHTRSQRHSASQHPDKPWLLRTGYGSSCLPYVVMRKPEPIDTTTLNYNWQTWETNAFSVYTKEICQLTTRYGRMNWAWQYSVLDLILESLLQNSGRSNTCSKIKMTKNK